MPHFQLWRGYHTTPVLALATHRKPKKSYRAQPVLLYFLASDTQDSGLGS